MIETPDESSIRNAAREAILELAQASVSDSEELISSGLIDSLSVLKLIALLEAKLSIRIPPQNLQPDDFDTIELIVETVQRVSQPKQ
jgi:acyl carrier protein